MPDPSQFGLDPSSTYLTFTAEFDLQPASLLVFARGNTDLPVCDGGVFDYEGEQRIDLTDADSTLYAFFPADFAFSTGDSVRANKQPVLRYLYTEEGKHYFVTGVPYSWIQNAPPGDIIIDPTIATGATEDVWIENSQNKNGNSAGLLVGKATGFPKKRTLVHFDLSGVPANVTVLSARLKLKYNTSSGTWTDRNIGVHQMLVDWKEGEATRDNRLTGTAWAAQYGLAGTDYADTAESSLQFTVNSFQGSYQYWDLTALAQKWVDGTANFGVMLIADNESTNGQDLRFSSSESAWSLYDQPYLEVEWYQPTRTVYFLKDHLGSIRATVDDAGQVVAYDDYDPFDKLRTGRGE